MDMLRSMAVFVSIADKGSLTAAGKEHGISSTMAGNHLQALEARLGVRLLNRTTRRQSLTEFGHSYYEKCVEILRLVSDADSDASHLRAKPRGKLRLAAPVTFGAEQLMPALGKYLAEHRDVTVELSLNDRVVDLVEEGFEAAIRTARAPDNTSLTWHFLAPYRMMICASPDYLGRRGLPRQPHELLKHDCLLFNQGSKSWRISIEGRSTDLPITARVEVNSGQALRVAALSGLGIIMQPAVLVASDVKAGRLVHLLQEYDLPGRSIYLVHLPDRRISAKLQSFITFMLAHFGSADHKNPASIPYHS